MDVAWLILGLLIGGFLVYKFVHRNAGICLMVASGIIVAVVTLHVEGTLKFLPRDYNETVKVDEGAFCLVTGSGYLTQELIFDEDITEEDIVNFISDGGSGSVELNIKSRDDILFTKKYGSYRTYKVEDIMNDWKSYQESGEIRDPSVTYHFLGFYFKV